MSGLRVLVREGPSGRAGEGGAAATLARSDALARPLCPAQALSV